MLRAKRQRTNELLVRTLWLEINTRGKQFSGPVKKGRLKETIPEGMSLIAPRGNAWAH
jgi:hypothetical protein